MNLFKKLWFNFRWWWYRRGHAEVGETIFYGSSCYQVIDQCHTCVSGPPSFQVIKTIPLPEAAESYVSKSEYQRLTTPHPPTTLTGLNRCLYALYHFLYADQLLQHQDPLCLHFSRVDALDRYDSIDHVTFAPLPYPHRVMYWRPRMGRWFLHTAYATQITLNLFTHREHHDPRCRIVLLDGSTVDRAHVLGPCAAAPLSWCAANTYSSPF